MSSFLKKSRESLLPTSLVNAPGVSSQQIPCCCLLCALLEMDDLPLQEILGVVSKGLPVEELAKYENKAKYGFTKAKTKAIVATARYIMAFSGHDVPIFHGNFFSPKLQLKHLQANERLTTRDIIGGDIMEIFISGKPSEAFCFKLVRELLEIAANDDNDYDEYHGVLNLQVPARSVIIDTRKKLLYQRYWQQRRFKSIRQPIRTTGNTLNVQFMDFNRLLVPLVNTRIIIVNPVQAVFGTAHSNDFPSIQEWMSNFHSVFGSMYDIVTVFLIDCSEIQRNFSMNMEEIHDFMNRDMHESSRDRIKCVVLPPKENQL